MEFIQKQLEEIKELLLEQKIQQKEFLTLEEAKNYLQLSKSCMYKMTCKKEIPYYVPGGKKIYFKKTELDEWVLNSKVSSTNDLKTQTEEYLARNNNNPAL